ATRCGWRSAHSRAPGRISLLIYLFAFIFLPALVMAADQASFFLPQNPVAAAYVLSRLSNRELIDAPRSEFVYVALLQRKGLDRKYRLEALDGLAGLRHTDRATQLLIAISELDKKGGEAEEPLRELGSLLLQLSPADLRARRSDLDSLKIQAKLPLTRQTAFGACLSGDGNTEPSWESTKSNATQRSDLILAIPLLADAALRAAFYEKLKPLLTQNDSP